MSITNPYKKEIVLEELRKLIFSKEYCPGQLLTEKQIIHALQLKIGSFSKAPIKHALSVLEKEKLITILPKRGVCISNLSRREAEEIREARFVLESFCVKKLANTFRKSGVAELRSRSIHEKLRRLIHSRNSVPIEDFVKLDLDFHCALAVDAGYETTFQEFLRGLESRFRLIALPSAYLFQEATVEEHGRILDAIEQRDPTSAQNCLKQHLRNAMIRWERRRPYTDP